MTESLFEAVPIDSIRLLNHFLKQHKEQTARRGDWNFWLKQGEKIVAVARLIPIESDKNSLWLRGLFVIESHRSRGVGQKIMSHIHSYLQHHLSIQKSEHEHLEQEAIKTYPIYIYAFPHGHLNDFYTRLGYQNCHPEALPNSLQARYVSAKAANKDWLCMSYAVVNP